VRFRRPIRQIQFSSKGIRFLNLFQRVARRRTTASKRSKNPTSFRAKYARKGPGLKRFRPPRHTFMRPTAAPKLHYQRHKERLRPGSGRKNGSPRWQKPSNILQRSRLRKLTGARRWTV
jgi:hypothetical protein